MLRQFWSLQEAVLKQSSKKYAHAFVKSRNCGPGPHQKHIFLIPSWHIFSQLFMKNRYCGSSRRQKHISLMSWGHQKRNCCSSRCGDTIFSDCGGAKHRSGAAMRFCIQPPERYWGSHRDDQSSTPPTLFVVKHNKLHSISESETNPGSSRLPLGLWRPWPTGVT